MLPIRGVLSLRDIFLHGHFYDDDDVQPGQLFTKAGQRAENLGCPWSAVRADTVGRERTGWPALGIPVRQDNGRLWLWGHASPEAGCALRTRHARGWCAGHVWYHTGDSGLCSEASCAVHTTCDSGWYKGHAWSHGGDFPSVFASAVGHWTQRLSLF